MTNRVDLIHVYKPPKERKLAAVPELQKHHPCQHSKQSHGEDNPKQTSSTIGKRSLQKSKLGSEQVGVP